MKYCRVCKVRAKDTDTVCARCGAELTLLGATVPAAGGDGADEGPSLVLQGAIRELEQAKLANVRRSKMLLAVCAGVFALILLVGWQVYASTVLSYAVLEDVRIEQDPGSDQTVRVSFNVVKPGKVAFDRRSGDNHTEKKDVYAQPGPISLAWTWPSDKSTGIDFDVIYRAGMTRSFDHKHFDVKSSGGRMVDIVFLMDTTGSMDTYIQGLQSKCIEFAEVVKGKGYDCRLALIGFGDVEFNEPIFFIQPTDDLGKFQTTVRDVPRTDGKDLPESTLEALERAMSLEFRQGARVCFVHITDASCHHERRIPQVAAAMKEKEIKTFIVAPQKLQNLYTPLCVNGGKFFSLDDARFKESLLDVAGTIASQISSQ